MSKESYRANRTRVFDIMGIDPKDRRYNCHHICDRASAKQGCFGDDFDVDGKANLTPMKIEDHKALHKRIQELEEGISHEKRRKNKTTKRKSKRSKRSRRRF